MNDPSDFTSDHASINFIQQTLCPRCKPRREAINRQQHGKRHHFYREKQQQQQKLYNYNISSPGNSTNTRPLLSDLLPLPPLTSSNAVDIQLYALLATLVRAFLMPWYTFGKFGDGVDAGEGGSDHAREAGYTSRTEDSSEGNDGVDDLIAEIVHLAAHCSRGVEERLRRVDVMTLLLDEGPAVVERHIVAYRIADRPIHPTPFTSDPRQLYHALNPHPALSPVVSSCWRRDEKEAIEKQSDNDADWRYLLAEGVLAVLLPSEELDNGCLRKLLTEVLADMVLGNFIGGIVSQPVFIWDGIARMAELVAKDGRKKNVEDEETTKKKLSASGKLEKYGLLDPVGLEVEDESKRDKATRSFMGATLAYVSRYCWLGMCMIYIAYIILRAVMITLATSSSLPRRSSCQLQSQHGDYRDDKYKDQQVNELTWEQFEKKGDIAMDKSGHEVQLDTAVDVEKTQDESRNSKCTIYHRPIMEMRIWCCVARLLDVEKLMPWVGGLAALVQWMAVNGPGKVGDVDGLLDLILASHLRQLLLQRQASSRSASSPVSASVSASAVASTFALILRSLRRNLTPENIITSSSLRSDTARTSDNGQDDNHDGDDDDDADNNRDSSENIVARSKDRCAKALLSLFPSLFPAVYYGVDVKVKAKAEISSPTTNNNNDNDNNDKVPQKRTLSSAAHHPALVQALQSHTLNLFDDPYLNRHLTYNLIELFVVAIMPELGSEQDASKWA